MHSMTYYYPIITLLFYWMSATNLVSCCTLSMHAGGYCLDVGGGDRLVNTCEKVREFVG